jgi:predicted AlkP superfamily phosphohydrolase/phosphomutase
MTGKNPGKHGIYAFTDTRPQNQGRHAPVDRCSISGETFFETLSRLSYRVGTAHIPLSFPPAAVNGFWVSGMTIPDGAAYTYPRDLQGELERQAGRGFTRNVGWSWLNGQWEQLFDLSESVARAQSRGLLYLLRRFDWDLLTYVFTSPDRIQHVAMRVLDPSHPEHDAQLAQRYLPRVHQHYELLDETLGQAVEQAGEDALVLLVSDHGFRPCWRSWSADSWLRQEGFLKTRGDHRQVRKVLGGILRTVFPDSGWRRASARWGAQVLNDQVDWARTQAYVASATEQGIRINLKGREPFGIVQPLEYDGLRGRLAREIADLHDPITRAPFVRQVYLREELFHGRRAREAPDLVFSFTRGITEPTNSLGHTLVEPTGWKSGDHRVEGIIVACGPSVRSGQRIDGARLVDIAPTVLHVLGAPVPEDVDGQVLERLFATSLGTVRSAAPAARDGLDTDYSREDQLDIEERLRSLGYL